MDKVRILLENIKEPITKAESGSKDNMISWNHLESTKILKFLSLFRDLEIPMEKYLVGKVDIFLNFFVNFFAEELNTD